MKNAIIYIIGSILFVALVAACGGAGQGLSSSALGQAGGAGALPTPTPLPTPIVPEKPTYVVQSGAVINALEFTGRVSPVTEKELTFGRPGTVKTVFVQAGDDVKAGDVIAELDISDLEKGVEQAVAALESAEFELEKAKLDHTEQLIRAEINLQKERLKIGRAHV